MQILIVRGKMFLSKNSIPEKTAGWKLQISIQIFSISFISSRIPPNGKRAVTNATNLLRARILRFLVLKRIALCCFEHSQSAVIDRCCLGKFTLNHANGGTHTIESSARQKYVKTFSFYEWALQKNIDSYRLQSRVDNTTCHPRINQFIL